MATKTGAGVFSSLIGKYPLDAAFYLGLLSAIKCSSNVLLKLHGVLYYVKDYANFYHLQKELRK